MGIEHFIDGGVVFDVHRRDFGEGDSRVRPVMAAVEFVVGERCCQERLVGGRLALLKSVEVVRDADAKRWVLAVSKLEAHVFVQAHVISNSAACLPGG